MYRAKEKQMSIYDYLPPYHGELRDKNRWVRLAEAIDWDRFEQGYSELFAPSGKAAISARIALGCRVIQLHYEVGPRGGAAGAGKPLPAVFFGHGNFQR